MVVADTHAFVWWVAAPDRLSEAAADALGDADQVGISTHTCLEIAWLVASKRLVLSLEVLAWLKAALAKPGVTLLQVTPEIAVTASRLTALVGRDPADCVITATAMLHAVPLVTRDEPIRAAGVVATVW